MSSGSFFPPKRSSTKPAIRSSSVVPMNNGMIQITLPGNIVVVIEIVEIVEIVHVVIVVIIVIVVPIAGIAAIAIVTVVTTIT